jgi:nitronate monooxygenase
MVLDDLHVPIVLAPMAGGPSTPALAAAVAGAGGLGFVAGGYLDAGRLAKQLAEARAASSGPLGVNLFVPNPPSDLEAAGAYLERLRGWAGDRGAELGEPRYSDDDWLAKLDLLTADPPAVASFTFGCPAPEVLARIQAAGAEAWVTVTSRDEALEAVAAGAGAVVAQGGEAGGHRASFADRPDVPVHGLLPLLQAVTAAVDVPVVASGGIATGRALAAALACGARAAQIGTAFMLAPEAGTVDAHRVALRSGRPTALTRAFTGRLARGIRNEFMDAHDHAAPIAYPELHYVTAPLRRAARERGDAESINLWAGEAYELAEERPAAEIVRRLAAEAAAAAAPGGAPPTSSPA